MQESGGAFSRKTIPDRMHIRNKSRSCDNHYLPRSAHKEQTIHSASLKLSSKESLQHKASIHRLVRPMAGIADHGPFHGILRGLDNHDWQKREYQKQQIYASIASGRIITLDIQCDLVVRRLLRHLLDYRNLREARLHSFSQGPGSMMLQSCNSAHSKQPGRIRTELPKCR